MREQLADNADCIGQYLTSELKALQVRFPTIIRDVRGIGLMMGIEFAADASVFARSDKSVAIQVVNPLHEHGLLTVPACRR